MRRGRRVYDKEDYFNFLYDLSFYNDDEIELAQILHDIPYEWKEPMDENREWDGIEIRKYYLADELGYLPDDIDVYDEYVFPKKVSVFEMFAGFSNRLCRDIISFMTTQDLIELWLNNLGVLGGRFEDANFIKNVIKRWEKGDKQYYIFKRGEKGDLWMRAFKWLDEYEN